MNAIEKSTGACVILAGAGTGKTYALVEKIKYLVNNKIYPPEKIVCLTFSNEAANSLAARVRKECEFADGKEPLIKTFHSFSAQILREHGAKIGVSEKFGILDDDGAKIVLYRNLGVAPHYCHRYIDEIGTAKDLGIEIDEIEKYLGAKIGGKSSDELNREFEERMFEFQTMHLKKDEEKKNLIGAEIEHLRKTINLRKFLNCWKAYEKVKEKMNYLDYADLGKKSLELLERFPEIAANYDYLLVDEFQDTNKVQLEFVKAFAVRKNLTIVGDLNQSIYRFRGACRENFTLFKKYFNVREQDIFNLDKSYRSSNKVLRAAHKLILNNYSDKGESFEVLNFEGREGGKIEVYEMNNGKEEARKVAELAEKEIADGKKPEEICVMFRTHQQGRIIKKVLESRGLKCYSVSKEPLLKNREIKILINYLNILHKLVKKKSGGMREWWELIYLTNFLKSDLIKIGSFIRDNQESENFSAKIFLGLEKLELSPTGKSKTKMLTERIKFLIPSAGKNAGEIVQEICNVAGLMKRGETKKEKETMINLNKFCGLAREHTAELDSFIDYLNALENLGIEIGAGGIEEGGIRMMTLHATKGLEYKTVIITNLAEKRFPLTRFENNSLIPVELSTEFENVTEDDILENEMQSQIFEERRLCYVAFTRAKEKLILTYAKDYGGRKFYASRFLEEVDYRKNEDFVFNIDEEQKFEEPKTEKKIDLIRQLKSGDFAELADAGGEDVNDLRLMKFSPTSLLTFKECEKKFEYKYVYGMPEKKIIEWDALLLGSFVHKVLEIGVKQNFKSFKEFADFARQLNNGDDWANVDIDDALYLIRIFFERNKDKYSENSRTEQHLEMEIDGIKFRGFADRIDFNNGIVEIVDYKTGKWNLPQLSRDWQMGYYALAAAKFGKVKKITLEMLRHEKPLEFEVDEKGNARAVGGRMSFNIFDVRRAMVATAKEIFEAYGKGFKPCPAEKNCEFCNEWIY